MFCISVGPINGEGVGVGSGSGTGSESGLAGVPRTGGNNEEVGDRDRGRVSVR